jgi:hypothetical protein
VRDLVAVESAKIPCNSFSESEALGSERTSVGLCMDHKNASRIVGETLPTCEPCFDSASWICPFTDQFTDYLWKQPIVLVRGVLAMAKKMHA